MSNQLAPEYKWYSTVSGDTCLEQGDIINDFPVPLIPKTPIQESAEQKTIIEIANLDLIVISQSCDIIDMIETDDLFLCERVCFLEAVKRLQRTSLKDAWEKFKSSKYRGACLLNKCDISGFEFDYQVVYLNKLYALPYGYVKEIAKSHKVRVRLLPPYREYLSQSFSNRFMRIGLPIGFPNEYSSSSNN